METVENKYITLAYKLYTIENGEKEFTEEAPAEHPFQFISGLGLTLESFENQVKDLNKGDKFDFTIKAEEAYGEYDEEHVIDLPKNIFEIEGKFDSERVVEGAVIPLMTSEGQRINGSVVEVKDDVVVMDMNHPLAGCDLNFVGEITENRPATNDELSEMARMMSG
ncbi:MAG: FKBP-type peptidyl-prolyl cis-trans isomerase, partial [Bacteroides sp.]|nr:FKBP-type peptidyl-prolyl cis-trans isomerase [Bacteroides sp.]